MPWRTWCYSSHSPSLGCTRSQSSSCHSPPLPLELSLLFWWRGDAEHWEEEEDEERLVPSSLVRLPPPQPITDKVIFFEVGVFDSMIVSLCRYDEWTKSEEWNFQLIYFFSLGGGSTKARGGLTCFIYLAQLDVFRAQKGHGTHSHINNDKYGILFNFPINMLTREIIFFIKNKIG